MAFGKGRRDRRAELRDRPIEEHEHESDQDVDADSPGHGLHVRFALVDDAGNYVDNAELNRADKMNYGCGMFCLSK